jgi:hypothetical protein
VELLYGNTDYLYGMTLVVLWLLYYGSLWSWFLMLRLAKLAQEHKAGGWVRLADVALAQESAGCHFFGATVFLLALALT